MLLCSINFGCPNKVTLIPQIHTDFACARPAFYFIEHGMHWKMVDPNGDLSAFLRRTQDGIH